MEVYGGLWRFMGVYGGLWRFMEVYGGLWRFMEVYGWENHPTKWRIFPPALSTRGYPWHQHGRAAKELATPAATHYIGCMHSGRC